MYHKLNGDEIIWDVPLFANSVDKIYVSNIFTKNKYKAEEFEVYNHVEIGGSGYDLKKILPIDIENMKPKINYGFASRGCIRNCEFCIVPEKEGYIRPTGDLLDIWDGNSKIVTFLDNNILALPDHFSLICKQAQNNDLTIDFNQGLDIRLLTDDVAGTIKKTKMKRVRFALDFPELIPICRQKIAILRKYMPKLEPIFYVLTGYNTTIDQDLERLYFLKSMNCRAYVMRHDRCRDSYIHLRIAQWVNMFWTFMKYDFKEFKYIKDNERKNFERVTINLWDAI